MIRSLRGTVLAAGDDAITLDVAGFGLELFATGSLLAIAVPGEELTCPAYLQVSDAGMSLFGFSDETERELFLEITQVKTMGGKLSIALLRHLGVRDVIEAITTGDARRLAVPGLGPKRAERIIFELAAKVGKKFRDLASGGPAQSSRLAADTGVALGLAGLGFSQSEAANAIARARADAPDRDWTEEALMMAALSLLQRR